MRLQRREFLAGSTALAASAALGLHAGSAHGQVSLGEIKIDVVSDGSLTLPGGFIFDPMPKDELLPILEKYGQSAEALTPPCNVTLMRDGTNTVLFDAGSGSGFQASAGLLPDALDAVDVAPEDVTHIVFTHGHPDHLWGVLDDFDDPMFPAARHMMGRAEWDYWINPQTAETIQQSRTTMALGAKREELTSI